MLFPKKRQKKAHVKGSVCYMSQTRPSNSCTGQVPVEFRALLGIFQVFRTNMSEVATLHKRHNQLLTLQFMSAPWAPVQMIINKVITSSSCYSRLPKSRGLLQRSVQKLDKVSWKGRLILFACSSHCTQPEKVLFAESASMFWGHTGLS